MSGFRLAAIPVELRWALQPAEWRVEGESGLSILAGPKSDLFIDPAGGQALDSAPAALFVPPNRDFRLSARVAVDFRATYDAGVLQLRAAPGLWAKLCFERSPQGRPTVVSVVTRGSSDDCNSTPIGRNDLFLRISRSERTFAFHYSLDGSLWSLVRYFTLGPVDELRVGFSAQSPTGEGCRLLFSAIAYRAGALGDIRSGE